MNTTRKPIKRRNVQGTRRMVREKILQLLYAGQISGVDHNIPELFDHIFYHDFQFLDQETPEGNDDTNSERILRPDEVEALEADGLIRWQGEHIAFAHDLLKYIDETKELSRELINQYAKNWKLERITPIDYLILQIAIAELVSLPEVPKKVTINEAIEVGKRFSTDKSGLFINGLLDAVVEELEKQGKITKSGRGLLGDATKPKKQKKQKKAKH